MSSSGVCNSPSYKHETERRNNEAFDDSSTRVFVFKEVSSLDEDDSCNLGRRNSWSSKLGLVKKIKLSEDGTALPTVERGIKKQKRPSTASKLSDIAVNKYPDSIFKVYIPEGNRIIRKKRVVPLLDMKPMTPVRTGSSYRSSAVQARNGKTISSHTTDPPMKTKHSIPHQILQNNDRRFQKGTGENSEDQSSKSVLSGQAPKKMTHITDISLTKEQETKRMKEREVMRKRTMDVVKMAFPATANDEAKLNESGVRSYDSEISGDENSRQKKHPSKSKSSLKSYSSVTSCGQPVTGKRSVTWGENEWSDSPGKQHGDNKTYPRMKKKIVHCNRNSSSSIVGRTDLRSISRSKLASGSRSHLRSFKGMTAHSNRREKKKTSRTRPHIESHKPPDKNESNPLEKKDTYTRRAGMVDDSYSDSDRKDESDSADHRSRERFQKKKYLKDKKLRRCDCGRVIKKNEIESENEMEKKRDQNNRQNEHGQHGNKKYNQLHREGSFQTKRTAIIRKHSAKGTLVNSRTNNLNSEQDSDPDLEESNCNDEEMVSMKRGRSTPSLRKISTVDCSYGSSDSEICFRKDNINHHSEKSPIKIPSKEKSEEKPLQKIFDSSNYQIEDCIDEFGQKKPSAESSKSFDASKIITMRECEQIFETDENSTEDFKTPQLNIKSANIEELREMQDTQLKYLREEDSTKDDLGKENCILNLKSVVHCHSEKTKCERDNAQNSSLTSSRCDSLTFAEHLSSDYVCVDAYNMVTNSSKSLSREKSNSVPLIREAPMLNLSYDDKSVRSNLQGTDRKLELPIKSQTSVSKETNTIGQYHSIPEKSNAQDIAIDQGLSQQELLQNDYSQSFKVISNNQDSGKRKPALRTRSSVSNNVSDSKNSSTMGTSRNKMSYPEQPKPAMRQSPKQSLSRNPPEKNDGISEKNIWPQSPKAIEDRKLHLQKMLSRGESVGASRMANQIMEKWHSTQMSISQRKEKMLASIRDTRHVETERAPTQESKNILKRTPPHRDNKPNQLSSYQIDYRVIQNAEDNLSIEENTFISDDGAISAIYETQPIEQCESVKEEDEASLSEKEDFETTIIMPGSRIPQPYSSTNIFDASDRHLDESLSPYTNEDTPEKPLCESPDSGIIVLPYHNNLSLGMGNNNQISDRTANSDLEEELPERDFSPIDSSKNDKIPNKVHSNARSSGSDLDSNYGSTRSNASNNESSVCSHIHNLNVEDAHSNENYITTQIAIQSKVLTKNVQEPVLSKTRNVLPKSASYSRATSRERPMSRRSKASSSGCSRRSVDPGSRPPSRKPYMINTSDDDSDREIITTSSPFHVDCYSRNGNEPLKKAPTSRMYSTLNHTPHPGQESIKTAIRDLDSIREDARSSSVCSDRPMSSGQCSSRVGGYQSSSLRPRSGSPGGLPNIPKMSPGSVKILKEKSRNAPLRSATPGNINQTENVSECRNTKQTTWSQSTKRPESQNTKDQRSSKNTQPKSSPVRSSGNEKPPFRYFSRNRNDDDMWNLQKLKNITVNRIIENYVPPWERVDLTPPESALRERASNERRLGITSRVTSRLSSPPNFESYAKYQRNSMTKTPLGSASPVSASSYGGRTPIGVRSPLGGKTPVCPRTPVGGRTPVCPRTPVGGKTPVCPRTPVSSNTPFDCKTPIISRTPNVNLSPVLRSRTPVRNRTPNSPERITTQQRMVGGNKCPRSDDKMHQQTRSLPRKYN
ncbi:serine-rich adhesin for platelets isoform X2 [Halyomorpha halys]|uniref:serine-rich adhesin for platelets isoform X2 n=1 Tax=Halyomorpha halys TaxID=286706 RepID=UPI0006D50E73|nr:uncharacterized protein LOC106679860 isoform X2 [Halyomorpha halys]